MPKFYVDEDSLSKFNNSINQHCIFVAKAHSLYADTKIFLNIFDRISSYKLEIKLNHYHGNEI